ncbi:hypothetical protein [Bradyrhizobium zhanjiangense]|uniref:hypothetical protein n=1 Tax=Bradyrhizobium zhanjiangense TaxID=1325107 RepID=UPI0026A01428
MIDHMGFSVSDYERAKAFYAKALAPLGYSLIMEVTAEQTGHAAAAGFGADGKPDFWIGGEGAMNKPVHVAIHAKDRATVGAFYKAAIDYEDADANRAARDSADNTGDSDRAASWNSAGQSATRHHAADARAWRNTAAG